MPLDTHKPWDVQSNNKKRTVSTPEVVARTLDNWRKIVGGKGNPNAFKDDYSCFLSSKALEEQTKANIQLREQLKAAKDLAAVILK